MTRLFFIMLVLACLANRSDSQDKPAQSSNKAARIVNRGAVKTVDLGIISAKDSRPDKATLAEREKIALAFVAANHAELTSVLEHLKNGQTKQYDKAIRELYTISAKLGALKQTDAALYDLELHAWQLKSRIQLLSAKLSMSASDELKQELKTAIGERYDNRTLILQHHQATAQERAKKLETEIAEHQSRREAAIEKQFQSLASGGKSKSEKRAAEKSRTKSVVSP